MSNKDIVKSYILENYLFSNDMSLLKDDDSFLQKGILDSTGMLEVIYFLEEQFNVKVADEEMIPENLDSIDRIDAYIARKTPR